MSENLNILDLPHKGEFYDATDDIEVYENGKVWHCKCGHGIGTDKDDQAVRCLSCGRNLEDDKHSQRKNQTPIGKVENSEQVDFSEFGVEEQGLPNDGFTDEPQEDEEEEKLARQTVLFEHEDEEQSSVEEFMR